MSAGIEKCCLCNLAGKGALNRDTLIKETVRTMGYARSGTALISAIEKGLKFGRELGEIVLDEEKNFALHEPVE